MHFLTSFGLRKLNINKHRLNFFVKIVEAGSFPVLSDLAHTHLYKRLKTYFSKTKENNFLKIG